MVHISRLLARMEIMETIFDCTSIFAIFLSKWSLVVFHEYTGFKNGTILKSNRMKGSEIFH